MINTSKITQKSLPQQIAGLLPGCNGIEIMGVTVLDQKKAFWLQYGNTHYFHDLPQEYYELLKNAYQNDYKAVEFLSEVKEDLRDQVELYAYYIWGDLDGTPDILNGRLAPSENFRSKTDCPSLLWNRKHITIDDHVLSPREITMIDMMADDYKDAVIAKSIAISHSHYDALKRNLFKATNTCSKPALLLKAKSQKVI